jgi:hypothetical protein
LSHEVQSIGINPPLEIVAIEVRICGRTVSSVAGFGAPISSTVSATIGAAVGHSGGSTGSGRRLRTVGSTLRSRNSAGAGHIAVIPSTPVSTERIVSGSAVCSAVRASVG